MKRYTEKTVQILLVEDNPADVQLVTILLKGIKSPYKLSVVTDEQAATDYLFEKVKKGQAPPPDFILLDLNLPKKDGRQVLKEIKESPNISKIPVLILSTSKAEEDICRCYELHANCFITKPTDLERFNAVMKAIEDFWIKSVELPRLKTITGGA